MPDAKDSAAQHNICWNARRETNKTADQRGSHYASDYLRVLEPHNGKVHCCECDSSYRNRPERLPGKCVFSSAVQSGHRWVGDRNSQLPSIRATEVPLQAGHCFEGTLNLAR